jgi:hypothetical protein
MGEQIFGQSGGYSIAFLPLRRMTLSILINLIGCRRWITQSTD